MDCQTETRPLLVQARTTAWDMAVKRVADAKAALDQFDDQEMKPANKRYREGIVPREQVSETEYAWEVFVMVHHNAIRGLVETRAPHLAALTFKIETAIADSVFDGGYGNEAIEEVLIDLRALSEPNAPAP